MPLRAHDELSGADPQAVYELCGRGERGATVSGRSASKGVALRNRCLVPRQASRKLPQYDVHNARMTSHSPQLQNLLR